MLLDSYYKAAVVNWSHDRTNDTANTSNVYSGERNAIQLNARHGKLAIRLMSDCTIYTYVKWSFKRSLQWSLGPVFPQQINLPLI